MAVSCHRYDLAEAQLIDNAGDPQSNHGGASEPLRVSPFLPCKADEITQWITSQRITARSRFAVFLRILVHSTGRNLTKVDFPGNEDAERPGWDGWVEATEAMPWIPDGRSGWELGTNTDIKGKADGDFDKSVAACDEMSRKETTFVFVTPRRWAGKGAWVDAQRRKNLWKDVRVYDCVDLEQWLEQSIPGQIWLANETKRPTSGVRTLDACWTDWACVCDPPLAVSIFDSAIHAAREKVAERLTRAPGRPIVIEADSTDEALAFLAQLIGANGGEDLAGLRERVLVFENPGVFPQLAGGIPQLIAVTSKREVEREFGPYVHSIHTLVVYPRNAVTGEADISLGPVDYDTFDKALTQMGKSRDDVSRLGRESGRSLTVLRRRLASVPAIRTPAWATDHQIAASLVPFLFAGAWESTNQSDQACLELLAGGEGYEGLERELQALAKLDDTPVWSIGPSRGVISKIDLLYAIAGIMTLADLRRFFDLAPEVLGEDDPALDLDEDKRWAAAIYGKKREFSDAFRDGIADTLTLLAVHGKCLFMVRLGIDVEHEATSVVRRLLPLPLQTRILEANNRDLPAYAEAAPDEFLSILERDLQAENPACLAIQRPVDTKLFGPIPSYTGLLWALEVLAWNPITLARSAFILARLATVDTKDNWADQPYNSLEAVFRAWMPQTAANVDQRVALMKQLTAYYPTVAWRVCISQFGGHHRFATYSHKPRWRIDAQGFGEPFSTWGPVHAFASAMIELALDWENHSLDTLSDLVERMQDLHEEYRSRVCATIMDWAKNRATDTEKAALREKIRVSTRIGPKIAGTKNDSHTSPIADEIHLMLAQLEPHDVLNKHAWLFRDTWVQEDFDEIHGEEVNGYDEREARVQALRIGALREVRDQRGLPGLLVLSELGNASFEIGRLATSALLSLSELDEFLRLTLMKLLAATADVSQYRIMISGSLHVLTDDAQREAIIHRVVVDLSDDDRARLLLLAPFCRSTWSMVDQLSVAAQAVYWRSVQPGWLRDDAIQTTEAVRQLLHVGRPLAAFSCVEFKPSTIEATLLCDVLTAVVESRAIQEDTYRIKPYAIERAFKSLDASPAIPRDQKAALEFSFLDALAPAGGRSNTSYGIPNLEQYLESHPEFFVQAITWLYKRSDDGVDPEELQVPADRTRDFADRGYKLLDAIRRIPGSEFPSDARAGYLQDWVTAVRRSCAVLARTDIGDCCLGQLLAHAPIGDDGVWPCEQVRDVMESVKSNAMMDGAYSGAYSSRGVHGRGDGGGQERQLASRYRDWGKALQITHPFVASRLLLKLADSYDREGHHWDLEAGIRRRRR